MLLYTKDVTLVCILVGDMGIEPTTSPTPRVRATDAPIPEN